MVRLSHSVMILLAAFVLSGCKTDSQLLDERAQAYLAGNPTLDRDTATAISAHRLRRGMTTEQVKAAWGEPVIVERFDNKSEYWYFGCHWPHHCGGGSRDEPPEAVYESRAYFENGSLVSWKG